MKKFKLPATRQNDYYGKAVICEMENGDIFLISYKTVVCGIVGGNFCRFWDDYSVTTMNHINDFCRYYGFKQLSKKEWSAVPVSDFDSRKYPEVKNDYKYKATNNLNYGYNAYLY